MIRRRLFEGYSPLYFLAALGAGGVAITFFIYLTFMVDHPDTPMVTFDHLWPILANGHPIAGMLVGLGVAAIGIFVLMHLRLLFWNLMEFRGFTITDAYLKLRESDNEATLMAIPLTLAMTINTLFVSGAVFVPNLWSVVEYLFPVALLAFLMVGILGLRIYARYFTRVISGGDFDFSANNNLGQLIAVFAFAMVSVGFAAPGAMSHHQVVNAAGIFGAVFFGTVAVSLGFWKFVVGFKSMLRYGIAPAAGPSLWIVIPILTLLGIALIRVNFGLAHGFGETISTPRLFVLTSAVLSLQLLFGVLGYAVMRRMGYFDNYLRGDKRHPGTYALVCPGVALFVFGMFFINFGLLKNGLIEQFSVAYFVALAPLVYLQFMTIATLLRINSRVLEVQQPMQPAGTIA